MLFSSLKYHQSLDKTHTRKKITKQSDNIDI